MSDAHYNSGEGIEDLFLRLERRYHAPNAVPPSVCLQVTMPDDYQFRVALNELVSRMGFEQVWDTDETTLEAYECAALGSAITIEECPVPSGDGVPIGATIAWWAGSLDGYLICDGGEVSKIEFPDLFNVIGYTFGGSGDNFRVPDCAARVIVGRKGGHPLFTGIGTTYGEESHELLTSEMPAHTHDVTDYNVTGGAADGPQRTLNGSGGTARPTSSNGGGAAHNNIQPSIAALWLIKAYNP